MYIDIFVSLSYIMYYFWMGLIVRFMKLIILKEILECV